MNETIKAFIASHVGRWLNLQVNGMMVSGKIVVAGVDGVVIEAVTGSHIAIAGSLIPCAAECDNEAEMEERLMGIKLERLGVRH